MSGVIKSIGKVFKKVVKAVKKVALPALAIGAVVLTGGAALGALPSVGSVLGGLGLSSGVTSVLTTAVQGAALGSVASAITGKNIGKGAAMGFLAGGAAGALGAAGGGLTKTSVSAIGDGTNMTGAIANYGPGVTVPGATAAGGIGSGIAQGAAQAVTTAVPTSGGGLMGFLERNPLVAGNLIQGIGGGILAHEEAKDEKKREDRIRANYGGYVGVGDTATVDGSPSFALKFDPSTGRVSNGRA